MLFASILELFFINSDAERVLYFMETGDQHFLYFSNLP